MRHAVNIYLFFCCFRLTFLVFSERLFLRSTYLTKEKQVANVEEYIILTDVETNTYTVSTPTVSMSFDTLQKAHEWAPLIATRINGGN